VRSKGMLIPILMLHVFVVCALQIASFRNRVCTTSQVWDALVGQRNCTKTWSKP
jgi:hypothetical protein